MWTPKSHGKRSKRSWIPALLLSLEGGGFSLPMLESVIRGTRVLGMPWINLLVVLIFGAGLLSRRWLAAEAFGTLLYTFFCAYVAIVSWNYFDQPFGRCVTILHVLAAGAVLSCLFFDVRDWRVKVEESTTLAEVFDVFD